MYFNREPYLPKSIVSNLPYTLDDSPLLAPLVFAYRELKKGDEVGLYGYGTAGSRVSLDTKNYPKNLEGFMTKYNLVMSLIPPENYPNIPRPPKEIAKELYKILSLHIHHGNKLSHDDINQTISAVTGYKKTIELTPQEKFEFALLQQIIVSRNTSLKS